MGATLHTIRFWEGACAGMLVAIASLAVAADLASETLEGKVVRVASGDTIVIEAPGEIEIRLADVGAPQGSQYYAPVSRQLLSNIVLGKTVRVEITGRSGPDRAFGHVLAGKLDVNLALVQRGAAWVCWDYAIGTYLLPYENDAKRFRRGVWTHTWDVNAFADCARRPPALARVSGA